MGRIVVGVDGSEHARQALRFAIDEARLRGGQLEVLYVWQYPVVSDVWGPPPPPREDFEGAARRMLDDIVASAGAGDVQLTTSLAEGAPAEALLAESVDADLLVVGSRGRGGFAGLLLGSVSLHCVTHARCPTVVVPPA